jgi:hypothetical protein
MVLLEIFIGKNAIKYPCWQSKHIVPDWRGKKMLLTAWGRNFFEDFPKRATFHVWCSNFVNFRSWAYPKTRRKSTSYDESKSVEFFFFGKIHAQLVFVWFSKTLLFFFWSTQNWPSCTNQKTQNQFWYHCWTIQIKSSSNPLSFWTIQIKSSSNPLSFLFWEYKQKNRIFLYGAFWDDFTKPLYVFEHHLFNFQYSFKNSTNSEPA